MPQLHRILDRVVFYGLLASIALAAIPYGSVQPWWTALFECMIFLLGVIAVVDLLITRQRLPLGASVALPLVLLCLFAALQSVPFIAYQNPVVPNLLRSISADPYSSQQVAIKLFALIVVGILLLRHTSSENRLRSLIYLVIAVAVASALLGFLRHGTQPGAGWFFPLPDANRGFAQFVNRNHFAFLVEMGLGMSLGLLVAASHIYGRLVLLAVAILLWVALIVSNSRGGIFASLCQLLFLVLLVNPFGRFSGESLTAWHRVRNLAGGIAMKVILIVSLTAVFAYGVSWIGGESVVTNFELSSYSFSQAGAQGHRENISRKDIWTATWQLIKARPILGAGFGGYWIAITKYHNAAGSYAPQEAHNDYLELLASGGLVGSALAAWFGVRFARITRNVLQSANGFVRQAALAATLGIFGVLIHSFLDFGLHIMINSVVFSILLAIPIVCYRITREQRNVNGLAESLAPEQPYPLALSK
jgi:O-antigen ligase